ncbi:lipopolysaccharide biosynthesis protein [Sandarakinorhabdus sp. DWP1-3-1]|uniref:lipopolysaccharide biosynthesis protein n=1 Tax=Sandarakinorhabdus sp. DWP1-3-1 TaxID=2804627 RepID=UPI003CF78C4D
MSVKRNIAANYIGSVVANLLSLLLVPIYIRYLSLEAYALVALFAVIQAWMGLLDLGMAPSLGREMARFTAGSMPIQAIRDLLRSLELLYFGIAGTVAVVLTLFAGGIARHWLNAEELPVETVSGALSMLGIVVAMRFCEGLYRSGIMGLQQQVWLNAAAIVLNLLRSLGALAVIVLVAPTVQAFFVWQGLVSLLSLIVLGTKLRTLLPQPPRAPRFSRAALVTVHRFAGGVFGTALLALLMAQGDKILLSRLLSLPGFGTYMLASTISGGLWLVGGPVVLAVSPALVRRFEAGDMAGLSAAYHQASQLVAVVAGPAAMLMAMFPYGLLFAWSGDAGLAARAAPILGLLAIGTLMNALYQVPHYLQMASGWTGLTLRLMLAAVAIMIPALLWLVPQHGAIAAAGIWASVNVLFVVVGVPLQHRRLLRGEAARWYLFDVLRPLFGAGLVMTVAWAVQPAMTTGRLGWLGFCMAAGLAALLASAALADGVRRRLWAFMASRLATG